MSDSVFNLDFLTEGWPLDPLPPAAGPRDPSIAHAPSLRPALTPSDRRLALANALRYFPKHQHEELAPEFAAELADHGHIYMYRLRPRGPLRSPPIQLVPARSPHAAAVILMMLNNLDPVVAQFPHELVTYGGNGQVFANWAQFRIAVDFLMKMEDDQTLSLYSGHPHGLFPSSPAAPRVVVTNGMMVPNYSAPLASYNRLFALGVTQYGQMTAGSFCYIGPQGIVHGTTLTLLNAARKHLGANGDLAGRLFVTSGLGGMSGAQAKAAVIAGCVGVVAEMSEEALQKRHAQGWLTEIHSDLGVLVTRIRECLAARQAISLGFHGNVVELWERLVEEDVKVDLGSDQTSCHNPFAGGYYPVGLSFDESRRLMAEEPEQFRDAVNASLKRQVAAINRLNERGMFFFDYGNAFLLQAARAGANVLSPGQAPDTSPELATFRYPTYIQDVLGDIFDQGFGPFRWVCCSGKSEDLATTDRLAASELRSIMADESLPLRAQQQYADNLHWIEAAGKHQLVVGSQARILYSDAHGRCRLAAAFNRAIADGELTGPVVLSRDHHDVSGTDSPFRETSNIRDGSNVCADMAVHNCIGDAFRGATWVALHNGGGVGWGEVMNGGFGLLLDGSEDANARAQLMLTWDVNNGVTRRAWAGNPLAQDAIRRAEAASGGKLRVTLPSGPPDEDLLSSALKQ